MTARPGPARGRAPPPAGGAPPPGPWGRAPPPPATPACRSAAPRPRSPSSTRPARHTVPWLPFPAIVASTAPSSRGADPAGGRLPPLRLDQERDSEPPAGVAGWLPSDYPMWLYADLKAYKRAPERRRRHELRARFDRVFRRRTGFATLDRLLARLHANKEELLLVLERPEVPLNTNGSERDL